MSCETENNLFPQRYEIDYVRVYQLQSIDDIELYGDLNLDNNLDVVDIILMVDYIVGNSNPSDQQFLIADMNQDGILNVLDVVLLVNLVLAP